MAEKGLFPDSAIILVVEDQDIIGRLLPPKMDKWRQKRDRKLARKMKIKEKKDKKRKEAMEKRRIELQKEMEDRKAERKVSARGFIIIDLCHASEIQCLFKYIDVLYTNGHCFALLSLCPYYST